MNKSENGSRDVQGMSAGYEVTEGPSGKLKKGKDLEDDRREGREAN